MPYLSSETARAMRNAIKVKNAPFNAKFSVRLDNYSSLQVTLESSTLTFEQLEFPNKEYNGSFANRGYRGVNHYYLDTNFVSEEGAELWKWVMAQINSVQKREIESVDGDYGNIPNFYISFDIGRYDKHYQVTV